MSKVLQTVVVVAFCASLVGVVVAAEPTPTKVVISGEMCGGCVKKITEKLKKTPGVAEVTCDIPTLTITVVPKVGESVSPKAVWKDLEAVGKHPTKLVGPEGTFTKTPAM